MAEAKKEAQWTMLAIDMKDQRGQLKAFTIELREQAPDDSTKLPNIADAACPSSDEDASLFELFNARQKAFLDV